MAHPSVSSILFGTPMVPFDHKRPQPKSVAIPTVTASTAMKTEPNTTSKAAAFAGSIFSESLTKEQDVIVAKYPHVFSKYSLGKSNTLLTGSKEETNLTAKLLLDVVTEGDKILNDPKETAARIGGVKKSIGTEGFIFKVDASSKPNETASKEKCSEILHIFQISKAKILGEGAVAIVLQILGIMEGKPVPIKAVRLLQNEMPAKFPFSGQSDHPDTLKKRVESVRHEFDILNHIHRNGEVEGLYHKPVTWIQLDPDFPSATGFVGREILEDFYDEINQPIPTKPMELGLYKSQCIQYCKQVMNLITLLAAHNLRCMDFKLENLLKSKVTKKLVLCDFGDVFLNNDSNKKFPGKDFTIGLWTPAYSTPEEHLALREAARKKDASSFKNIAQTRLTFAAAVTMFLILARDFPYEIDVDYIKPHTFDLAKLKDWSPDIRFILRYMLTPSAVARTTHEVATTQWAAIK